MVIVTKITIYFIVFILIGYSLLRFYHLWNRRGLPDWLYWMFQAVMLGTFFICQNKSVWIPDSMFKKGLLIFSAITFNVYLYTPVFCFVRGCIRWIHKKVEAKRGHRINRFFSFVNHPAKPIYLFIILSHSGNFFLRKCSSYGNDRICCQCTGNKQKNRKNGDCLYS